MYKAMISSIKWPINATVTFVGNPYFAGNRRKMLEHDSEITP